jgi:predicted amidohydrolase
MMICFDWFFPESARTLALKGAQIIAHPANLVMPYCQNAMVTRALENHVYAVTANRTGKESLGEKTLTFTGASQITDPKGRILFQAGQKSPVVHTETIDPKKANDKHISYRNHIFNDRRTKMYELIQTKTT